MSRAHPYGPARHPLPVEGGVESAQTNWHPSNARSRICCVKRTRPGEDRLIIAHLAGASSRHAGWRRPVGEARDAALAELREIATVDGHLRADLLAEEAGILLGIADVKGPPTGLHDALRGELLVDAGAAPPELVEEWRAEGNYRARPMTGGPFSAPLPGPPGR